MFTPEHLSRVLTYFFALLLSLTFHEAAHAWMAKRRGDDTAEQEGRLTLNPAAHVDVFGTIILPLLGALMLLPVIGWAKPVPVDLRKVKNPKWDNVLIAAAGPLSNILMCLAAIFVLILYQRFGTATLQEGHFLYPIVQLGEAMIWVNIFLALFNLLPLPPLDGAAVFGGLLPYKWSRKYEEIVAPYGFILLLMIVVSGGLHWLPKVGAGFVSFFFGVLSPLLT